MESFIKLGQGYGWTLSVESLKQEGYAWEKLRQSRKKQYQTIKSFEKIFFSRIANLINHWIRPLKTCPMTYPSQFFLDHTHNSQSPFLSSEQKKSFCYNKLNPHYQS